MIIDTGDKTDRGTLVASVAICIPTYRRPESLRRLLDGILATTQADDCRCTIIVVDND